MHERSRGVDLDDLEASFGLDDRGHGVGLETKGRVVELGGHAAAGKPTQIAATGSLWSDFKSSANATAYLN